jgi:hypothetical protein
MSILVNSIGRASNGAAIRRALEEAGVLLNAQRCGRAASPAAAVDHHSSFQERRARNVTTEFRPARLLLGSAPMELFWFIPTHGDGRYLGTTRGARPVSHAYAAQIARAADELG